MWRQLQRSGSLALLTHGVRGRTELLHHCRRCFSFSPYGERTAAVGWHFDKYSAGQQQQLRRDDDDERVAGTAPRTARPLL